MSPSQPSMIGRRAMRRVPACARVAQGWRLMAGVSFCMALLLSARSLADADDCGAEVVMPQVEQLRAGPDAVPHSYELWSAGALFNEDANGDGVANGVAWLLGAPDKNANAASLVPKVMRFEDSLVLSFSCLRLTCRGGAVLKLQVMDGRAGDDPWVSHEAEVPDSGGTVNGASFVVTPHDNPRLIHVVVTIKGTLGEEPFARLVGILP